MESASTKRKKTFTLWYRLKRYPRITALSLGLVLILAAIFCYYLGLLYPQFKLFDGVTKYNFFSGQPGGAYYSIGNAINGMFGNEGDSIINRRTSGGSENGMKLTFEKESFGLIQEELINHDDQLRKNVRIVTPLFLDRMHIVYRKDLFKNGDRGVQLSANPDFCVLQCFRDSAININMGPVGSGTRIIASYIMTLIDQQINARLKKKTPKFIQLNEAFSNSFRKMNAYKEKTDSSVDILFYLNAAPIDVIKNVLDSGRYKLMSIDPSFVFLLNKEFGLGLRVADFKGKYKETRNIGTLGTLTYLVASKSISDGDIRSLLKKLDNSKDSINKSLIHNPHRPENQALCEFGFYKFFDDEYETSTKQRLKEVIIFLLSVMTLLFPVFKSVMGFKYIFHRWDINKKIDQIVTQYGNNPEENYIARSCIKSLKEQVINLYSDGLLSEGHYNPLMKRIGLYYEKFSGKIITKGKEKIIIPGNEVNAKYYPNYLQHKQ